MNLRLLFTPLLLGLGLHLTQAQELSLSNPLSVARQPEVMEVPLAEVLAHLHLSSTQAASLVARNVASNERIPLQLYTNTPGAEPDSLLLLVQLAARGKISIAFSADPNAEPVPAQVFGRDAPERKDDFAWENSLVAYRVYGPALQATGEITSGIDVWSKRVPNFVIDSFYKRDLEGISTHNPALSYHKDNGQGLDSYFVGPTRGCGGTAVFSVDKLYVSKNYTSMRMLSSGPLRFAFEVSYAPWDANGILVTETKRIVLDADTHLNEITSTYTFPGTGKLNLVAAIAVHDGADVSFPVPNKIAAVWDTPQDASAGRIATGLITPPGEKAKARHALGHAMLVFQRHSGTPFVYYVGAGWSKADMPDASSWDGYLKLRLAMLEHPLQRRWELQ
jgi:hypothetical protein